MKPPEIPHVYQISYAPFEAEKSINQRASKASCHSETSLNLHPGKLTWNPKMEVWKMIFLFNLVILQQKTAISMKSLCLGM